MEATMTRLEPTFDENHSIKACNSLLRGELSAIETYRQAIEKFDEEQGIIQLRTIEAEHKRSAFELREHILIMGGAPEVDSGAWGTLTHAIQSTANFFGEESAVVSLTPGEEIGKTAYENALQDEGMMQPAREIIQKRLLPRTAQHIATLEGLTDEL